MGMLLAGLVGHHTYLKMKQHDGALSKGEAFYQLRTQSFILAKNREIVVLIPFFRHHCRKN